MEEEKLNKSDHELLIKLNNDMGWLHTMMVNHLHSHKLINIALVSINGTLVVGVLIALLV